MARRTERGGVMFEIKAVTYEEARSEYLKERMQRAQRKIKYWESRIDRSRPHNMRDPAAINAADCGWEYNFYKDALEALENNKFQYETGFVKGFETAKDINVLTNQPKWTSVEERLPAVGEVVLVRAKVKPHESVSHDALTFASYWNDECWVVDFLDDTDEIIVTHWMNLPESPKEEA